MAATGLLMEAAWKRVRLVTGTPVAALATP